MAKKLFIPCVAISVLFGMWILFSETAVSNISSGIVRLHILANSDSEEDQKLKLSVRDRVLDYVRQQNTADEKIFIETHLDEILAVCREEIASRGCSDSVRAEIGNFYFPTKRYEQIVLPAGNYDAVRIVIGEGKGQNWWCVMYPPLCFTKETNGSLGTEEMKILSEAVRSENFEMIQSFDEKLELKPAFLLVEWWQEIKHTLIK